MEHQMYVESPIGILRLCADENAVTGLYFAEPSNSPTPSPTPLLEEAAKQLQEYFSGLRRDFSLPLSPSGTDFQCRVWSALQKIPYGHTWTYKQLAHAAGSPKGYRAVGLANNRNPISIFIPCHRVIGANGSLTGYGGGLDAKAYLLKLEGAKHF